VSKRGLLAVVVCLSLLVGGLGLAPACAPQAAPAKPSTPATPATPAAPVQPIKLVFHDPAAISEQRMGFVWAMDQLQKKTNGQVTVQFVYGGSLGVATDQLKNIGAGLFDMGVASPGYWPSELPLINISTVPGISINNFASLYAIAKLRDLPEIQAEATKQGVHLIGGGVMSAYEIISRNPIKTVADLKGMKIRGYAAMDEGLASFGALPVSMAFTEAYTAMERGTVEGVLGGYPDTIQKYKLNDIAKYVTQDMGWGVIGFVYFMNLNKWNSLPQNIQKAFDDVTLESIEGFEREFRTTGDMAKKSAAYEKQTNTVRVPWDAAARAPVTTACETANTKWVKDLTAKGLSAQKVYDTFKGWVNEYAAKYK
jgi:TRAP-type C4-dicarboxylate transport system substrate-binding protein